METKLYRCGWCGNVTDSTGKELEGATRDKAIRLHETYPTDNRTMQVDGECCSRGVNSAGRDCPNCYGSGEWEAECCNGHGGCSCQGMPVNMGQCRACRGTGRIDAKYNRSANSDFILRSGACFLGSGPSTGYWAGKPAMGY